MHVVARWAEAHPMGFVSDVAMSAALAPRVDAFLAYLRVERRYSPSTIDHYGRALATLVEFAESHALARWRDLRPAQVQGLLASEHRRGLVLTAADGAVGRPLQVQQPVQRQARGVVPGGRHPRPRVAPPCQVAGGAADLEAAEQVGDREGREHQAPHEPPGGRPQPEPVTWSKCRHGRKGTGQ